MQQTQNLWPSNLGDIQIAAPVQILAKQVEYFNEMMQNVLEASIVSRIQNGRHGSNDELVYDFRIKVPALGNYTLTVLSLYHDPVKLYPVRVEDKIGSNEQAEKWIHSEKEITDILKGIFGSSEMNETVSSLLVQVKYSGAVPF